jgi:formylglycine-generating enzyme required for sulfatase activity
VDVPAYGQAQAALREARALLDERRWREAVAKAEDGLRTKQLESELHAIRNEAAARAEEADATRAELQQLLGRRAYGEAHACLDRLRGLSCTTGAGATEWAEFERALSARVVGEVLSMAEGVLAKGEWSAVSQHARTVQSFERGNARAQELVVEAQFGSQSMQLDALLVCGRFEEARSLLASLQQLVTGAPGSEAKQAALTQAAKRAVRDACIRADGAFAQGAWTDAVEWARSALLFEPDDLRARELAISARQRLRAVHWRMASIASCSVAVLGFAIWALTTPDEHHGTTAGLCLAGACFLWLWAVLFVGVRRAVGAAPDGQPRESPRARTEASLAPAIASSAQHATAQSVSLPVTQVIDLGGVSLTLILIPAGTFQMGSPMEDLERFENEGPQHEVTISRPFYAGITEVTGEQWQAVMGNKPSQFKGDAGLPVERVSWDDCREFCRRLTAQLAYVQTPAHGFLVRLPSEAEWEYACRAGSRAGLSLSDNSSQLGDYAWRAGNSSSSTHPVGAKTPNAWGLYDMHGNVWEWCEDEYHGRYDGAPTDGSAWITGGDSRVRRGGSWISEARYCRSAARDGEAQSCRRHNLGLRVVAVPDWEARSA